MNTPAYQTVTITCPNCGNRFVTPVLPIIDAAESPEAKALFLSGQLNVAVCPQCGNAGMLAAPLVYHDPDKELLFTYAPPQAAASDAERERIIGDLTNRVISRLPPEERKGYLLRPRSFLTLESMVEAVLEADGITPEMLQAQRARAELLNRLLRTADEGERKAIVREDEDQIDYEFFQLLTVNVELAEREGRDDVADQLLALRSQLLAWTTPGQEIAAREEAIRSLGTEITREGLLDRLVEAALAGDDVKVETLVTYARPAIDYIFYQQLTARIDAARDAGQADRAQALTTLRETVLDLVAQVDAQMQQATEEAGRFLQQILDSDDPEREIRAHVDRVDDLFLSILASRTDQARKAGQADLVARLEAIAAVLLQLIQESQPEEVQFINELLSADYPEGTRQLLEENSDLLTPDFLDFAQGLAADLEAQNRSEAAGRLNQILAQARLLTP